MSLFLEFHRDPLPAHGTELLGLELLPSHTLLVLLMQTDAPDAVAGFLTVHAEDGALTTWHSEVTLLTKRKERKPVRTITLHPYTPPNGGQYE